MKIPFFHKKSKITSVLLTEMALEILVAADNEKATLTIRDDKKKLEHVLQKIYEDLNALGGSYLFVANLLVIKKSDFVNARIVRVPKI
jgi:hypothetical protein